MSQPLHVKPRLAAVLLLLLPAGPGARAADDAPDARRILETVRLAQTDQDILLAGRLRTGSQRVPFTLSASRGAVRWEFKEPPRQTLILTLGEDGSKLEEVGPGTSQKIAPARFDDTVRGTDISYEDLSMRFLYWPNAAVEGEQTMILQRCWIVGAQPPSKDSSQYSRVKLWIAQDSGALMQAEAYDRGGKLERRFKVISGQKTKDGRWILKQMRIESLGSRAKDRTPTYLEVEKPE